MTLREQLQKINSITTLEDVKIAYDALYQLLNDLTSMDNVSLKLVNYQYAIYMIHVLNKRHVELINEYYNKGVIETNSQLIDLFKAYEPNFDFTHIVQSRQHDVYHVELAFIRKSDVHKRAFMSISATAQKTQHCNDSQFDFDNVNLSIVLNDVHCAASVYEQANWYLIKDSIALERQVMLECELESRLKPIINSAITNKILTTNRQKDAEVLFNSIIEEYAASMYETLQYVVKPEVDFQMFSILPRHDGEPGCELLRYRVSLEKIHNINIDTSIMLLDMDGEVEVPEEFVRYESIRKKELATYMQQHFAFISTDEYNARLDSDNMFNWF